MSRQKRIQIISVQSEKKERYDIIFSLDEFKLFNNEIVKFIQNREFKNHLAITNFEILGNKNNLYIDNILEKIFNEY